MPSLQKLKVIIIGAGEVGSNVAERLSEYNEIEVTLIERDYQRSLYVQNQIDCIHIYGSALEPDVLREAGVSTADLFYAVTDSDEVNLLACQLAQAVLRREMTQHPDMTAPQLSEDVVYEGFHTDLNRDAADHSETPTGSEDLLDGLHLPAEERRACTPLRSRSESGHLTLFARMRSSSLYEHLKYQFPHTNILLPELACSRKLDELIHYQQLFDVIELESDKLKLYGVKIHPRSAAVGQSLRQFTQDLKITVAAIARPIESSSLERSAELDQQELKHHKMGRRRRQLLIPWADYEMRPHDAVYFAASPSSLAKLHRHFCAPDLSGHHPLVIAGENEVARDLFKRVVDEQVRIGDGEFADRNVSMIMQSEESAEQVEMSDSDGEAFVCTGSLTEVSTLIEAGVGPQSTLLICSHDEENLVCALLARELKCERILIVNNRASYARLINQLGFDGIFSPRQLAVNEISRQTLKLFAKSAYNVSTGDDVEVRSFVVSEDSDLCGLHLSELQKAGFPREHAVIAALIEQDSTTHVMPTGDDRLLQGSTVYVVSRSSDFHRIKGLFGKRKSRFRLW